MSFYELPKLKRQELVAQINKTILAELEAGMLSHTIGYFSDSDTFIRKSGYLAIGKIYIAKSKFQKKIIKTLESLLNEDDFKIRQTTVNAAGEIGKRDFEVVQHFFEKGLFDHHHSVRNAVIGSV